MSKLNRHTLTKLITILATAFPGFFLSPVSVQAQNNHSVAQEWNEVLLEAIRNDFARPTIHARNLFHMSIAMYDAWAAYDTVASPFFLGNELGEFEVPFDGVDIPTDPAELQAAREEAMSYACYRILLARFQFSPGFQATIEFATDLFLEKGYDLRIVSTEYSSGSPAMLGNYLAKQILDFGLQDGSNETFNYTNLFYRPVNAPMVIFDPGNPRIENPNRWQPLTLQLFIDQAGNLVPGNTPQFLSPEWGEVIPFALTDEDLTLHERDGIEWKVYHDPGPPPYQRIGAPEDSQDYLWGFSLVSIWSSHLDPNDGVMWDISPASIGNISSLPPSFQAMQDFYDQLEGGDTSLGHQVNPKTGQPYPPQMVPRGDYARILAEFWADGPDSETPPGHWFTILNYVNDHPQLEKRFKGQGAVLDDLEWDVKSYLVLGGAMHDAAITAWGAKGYYDYIRPVSAIRYLAENGQSTDPNLPNYSVDGIPLVEGFIELVQEGDSLALGGENIGKVKLFAWRGPDFIEDPEQDEAGVGWILAENWWPYQRPSFVTPPFAGYVSGHSTYSRAAAEVLTLLTGDPFFPGGVGEFPAPKDTFLVFEKGPSIDVVLQWATYRDASDQCSLSRIWGGIHPPADDIPGRLMGEKVGVAAFTYAETFFGTPSQAVSNRKVISNPVFSKVFPNPVQNSQELTISLDLPQPQLVEVALFSLLGKKVRKLIVSPGSTSPSLRLATQSLSTGMYVIEISGESWREQHKVHISGF
ncbi:MAG: DUF6851 domain-containing protein [Bacteroidota bacterium]